MPAKKAGRKPGTFKKGDPRINRRIAGPGRPKDEFKELCRRLVSKNATANRVAKILKDDSHPQFMAALKWATENGYGKATEHVELDARHAHYVVNTPAKGASPEAWQRQYNRN